MKADLEPPPELPTMGFLEHLDELRKRILWSLAAVVVGFGLALTQARVILNFLLAPVRPYLGGEAPVYIDITDEKQAWDAIKRLVVRCAGDWGVGRVWGVSGDSQRAAATR